MALEEEVLFEKDDKGIATVILNRPDKLNALSRRMLYELLPRAFSEVARDDQIRVMIITGAGRGFCSGADVKEFMQAGTEKELEFRRKGPEQIVGAIAIPLSEIPKPTIAAVNGIAAGMGFSLCLLCDFRIASDNAEFNAVFARRGLMPDAGMTFSLPRMVGLPRALELMLTGDTIDAKKAEGINLVNKVVPHDKLAVEARALAEKLAESAPIALSFTKRAAYHGLLCDLREQLLFESWGQNVCTRTEDHQEGVRAFLEKREPNFRGR